MTEPIILSIVFSVCELLLEAYHARERKELYSRLTCRDASEYHRITEKKRKSKLPPYIVSAKKWRDADGRADE